MMDNEKSTETTVHYVKSQAFFEAPLHGFFSGVNENGHAVLCPFSERMAIPTEQQVAVKENGDQTFKTSGKSGLVRTVHGAFHLDVDELRRLIENLQDTVKRFEDK